MFPASIIDSIIAPFAKLFGWVLAACFSFTHSFGLSIALLTLLTMIVVFPLTRAGTRSMMRMQLLQPEMMRLRNKHKVQPGMSAAERQAARVAMNEEMMALYKENGVNPTGGCLPMFLQFPVFIVLYNVIRGMTHEITVNKKPVLSPEYIPRRTQLYHAVVTSHGRLESFGLNLADSVRSPGSIASKLPYIAVILIAVVLQYVSIWQITNRNPSAAQANPQMQMVQKFMPLIFVVIYIAFPAGVGLYFIVSSVFRIGQQEYMYKHDPKIVESVRQLRERKALDTKAKTDKTKDAAASDDRASDLGRPSGRGRPSARGDAPEVGNAPARASTPGQRSLRQRLRDAAAGFQGVDSNGAGPREASNRPEQPTEQPTEQVSGNGAPPNSAASGGSSGQRAGVVRAGSSASKPQNRSRDKRPRR